MTKQNRTTTGEATGKTSAHRRSKANASAKPGTIAERIAAIEAIQEDHWQHMSASNIRKTTGTRRRWLAAVVELSKTRAGSIEEAFTKAEFLRELCGLCLVPLALQGINPDETFVVLYNLNADIRGWGLPLPQDIRH